MDHLENSDEKKLRNSHEGATTGRTYVIPSNESSCEDVGQLTIDNYVNIVGKYEDDEIYKCYRNDLSTSDSPESIFQ